MRFVIIFSLFIGVISAWGFSSKVDFETKVREYLREIDLEEHPEPRPKHHWTKWFNWKKLFGEHKQENVPGPIGISPYYIVKRIPLRVSPSEGRWKPLPQYKRGNLPGVSRPPYFAKTLPLRRYPSGSPPRNVFRPRSQDVLDSNMRSLPYLEANYESQFERDGCPPLGKRCISENIAVYCLNGIKKIHYCPAGHQCVDYKNSHLCLPILRHKGKSEGYPEGPFVRSMPSEEDYDAPDMPSDTDSDSMSMLNNWSNQQNSVQRSASVDMLNNWANQQNNVHQSRIMDIFPPLFLNDNPKIILPQNKPDYDPQPVYEY